MNLAAFDADMASITGDWNDVIELNGKKIPCLLDGKVFSKTLGTDGYGSQREDDNTAYVRTELLAGQDIRASVTIVKAFQAGSTIGVPFRVQGKTHSPDAVVVALELMDPRN